MAVMDEKKKIVLIAAVIVAVSGAFVGFYVLTGQGELPAVNYTTYTNENYGFKFDYPANWNFKEFEGWVFSTWENNGSGNIGLSIEFLGVPIDNSYISWLMSMSENMLENNENLTIINKPTKIAIDNHYGWTFLAIDNMQLRNQLVFQEYYIAKDDSLYHFEMTCEKNYLTYEPIFQHVIDSFSFLD
jgi:hypothetical protein